MASRRAGSRGKCAGFYREAKRIPARFVAAALLLAPLVGPSCNTVPVTGRTQLNQFSIEQDKELGAQAYKEVISQSKIADNGPEAEMVRRVVSRLAAVSDDPGFDWEVHVIDDPQMVNAWCMPGGKIAVYTGILPVTQDETGLAVVLGHEIAHAIARHGTERMTTQGATETGLAILAGSVDSVGRYQQYVGLAANLFVFMPWGRRHELEADRIGLIYMARAGYDPREAIDFWKRMDAASGSAPPEFLSTHPGGATRIQELHKQMPEALAEYSKARGSSPDQL